MPINRRPRDRLPSILIATDQQADETREEYSRDFQKCETGTGQQVAQLHV
jgi:hypothetical protein